MAYAERKDGKLTGTWIARVRRGSKLFKRSFPTRVEAQDYERHVRQHGNEPGGFLATGAMARHGRSFREVAAACRAAGGPEGAWKRGRDRSVFQRLDYCVTQLGDFNIDDVTRAAWRERIVAPLEATGHKQGTINRYTTALSAVLTWALEEGIIDAKPALKFPKEHDRTERHPLSFEGEDKVCAWLAEHGHPVDAACVHFLAWTGLRKGELYALRPAQIKNDHLILEKEQTKTNCTREVYVAPAMAREMRAIIVAGALPDRTQLVKRFQKAAAAVGLDHHVVIHGLRHTIRTRMRKAGVSEHVIRAMLGHSRQSVSEGYDHVDLEDQRRAVEAVGQSRGPISPVVSTVTNFPSSQAPDIAKVG
jgi:integrase